MPIGSVTGGLSGGGRNLGSAHGTISIDTSPAQRAGAEMRRIGQDVAKAMQPAKAAVSDLERALADLSKPKSIGGNIGQQITRSIGPAQQSVDQLISRVRSGETVFTRIGNTARAGFGQAQAAGVRFTNTVRDGLNRVGQGITSVGQKVNSLRGELLAVGAAGAILSGLGLKTAAGIEEARIQLKGLAGGEKEAARLMENLRAEANKAGIPFADMLQVSRQLLPTFEGNTQELEKWVPLVRRVAALRPSEGVAGAAFAINEALVSGGRDLVSLAERFNISKVAFREAMEQTGGDAAAALDLVLTKMGITQEVADEIGTTFNASFNRAKDSALQLLGAGFTPLLNALTPILQRGADWLNQLRETRPAVAGLGAGLIGVVTVGAPLLLFLGQVVSSLEKIKALSFASTLGKAAGFGLAAAAGVGLGIEGTRAIGRATGNEQLAQSTIGDLVRILKQGAFIVVAGLSELAIRIGSALSKANEFFINAIAGMVSAMAGFTRQIGELLPDMLGGSRLKDTAANLEDFAEHLRGVADSRQGFRDDLAGRQQEFLQGVLRFLNLNQEQPAADGGAAGPSAPTAVAKSFTEEQIDAITGFYEQLAQIDTQAAEQRLSATRQYEQQRTQTIAEFERTIARDAADFARQRARQNQQLERDIANIRQEAVEREAEWLEDLNATIAELTAESGEKTAELTQETNERVAEIEEQFARDREKAAQDHQLKLLDAASRLDARAVADEQRRFALSESQAVQDHAIRLAQEQEGLQERLAQEQTNLQERIAQEQEAHAQRLEEARIADEERIADMRATLAEQQRLEDEDRAIRLARMRDDHNRQLEAMKKAHLDQLAEIDKQTAAEKMALNKRFQEELADLELASEAYLKAQKAKEEAALKSFESYWDEWNKMIDGQIKKIGGAGGGSATQSFQHGGPVAFTGTARVHGSAARPEYMLSADTTSRLKAMMGNFTQPGLVNAVGMAASGGGGRSFQMGDVSIQVIGQPGQSPQDIALAVRNEFTALLRDMAN